jgi:hypothetical protein
MTLNILLLLTLEHCCNLVFGADAITLGGSGRIVVNCPLGLQLVVLLLLYCIIVVISIIIATFYWPFISGRI